MLTTILLATLGLLLLYIGLKLRQRFNYWHNLGIACDPPNWFLGSFSGLMTTRSFDVILKGYYNKYRNSGPFAGLYWFTKPSVFVLDPELIKHVLIKDFSKFSDRGMYSNEEDDPLSGQLFNLDGAKWRHMRNKLSPTFTSGKMKTMFPLVIKIGEEFIKVFQQTVASNEVVDVRDLVSRFTTDVIGTCAFGMEIDSLHKPQVEFRKMSRKAFVEQRYGILGFIFRFNFPHLCYRLHIKETTAEVEKFFMGIVGETVEYREKNHVRRNDFMDMLIDLKNNKLMKSETGDELTNLTFGQIAAQAFVFLLAGFETSSTTMGFALYELAQHQDIQKKARDEINMVLENHNNQFSYECMKEMVYLEQVMEGKHFEYYTL